MAAADAITTSASPCAMNSSHGGCRRTKIVVVPNGIEPVDFSPMRPDPDLRAGTAPGERWVFGYVSNMDHVREGHELLIDATARWSEPVEP